MEAAFNPEHWSDFLVAQVGAAAALTGLVIVAISINLKEIVGNRMLSSRAAETVGLLGGVLISATLVLVPGQPRWLLGAELAGVGFGVAWRGWRRSSSIGFATCIMTPSCAGCAMSSISAPPCRCWRRVPRRSQVPAVGFIGWSRRW